MTFTEKDKESVENLERELLSVIYNLQKQNSEMKELLREHGIKYPQQKAVLLTNQG